MAITRLVSAAGGPLEGVIATIDDLGAPVVADIVLGELRHRADIGADTEAEVRFVLRHGGDAVSVHLPGEPSGAAPDAVVEQSLAEVVQGLFGPRGPRPAATRVLRWRDLDSREFIADPPPTFAVVRRLLDAIDRPYATGLSELCVRYGSDKWGIHQYPRHYERHFDAIRDRPLTILEIGVGGYADPGQGGASLHVWKRYFPRASVFGLDITDKSALSEQRLTVLAGDQSSPADLSDVVAETGPPDIVIDDGSHVSAHLLASFEALFPVLRDGGLYVLEDLQTSYWPNFGGRADVFDDPVTSVGFLKQLVDGLNHEDIDGRRPRATDATIGGLHFYHNLCFVEKATNLDGAPPSWIPRS
ncbi:class I SAM-dependent methyltransferase [Amycolatopsis sp. NPDC059027]|uniref:class I SAM-dependent methyltransferase n=1 Tax=Amycolatopsis sp. NPDC059027 TaxID=3346709 RepID=UPI00367109CF